VGTAAATGPSTLGWLADETCGTGGTGGFTADSGLWLISGQINRTGALA